MISMFPSPCIVQGKIYIIIGDVGPFSHWPATVSTPQSNWLEMLLGVCWTRTARYSVQLDAVGGCLVGKISDPACRDHGHIKNGTQASPYRLDGSAFDSRCGPSPLAQFRTGGDIWQSIFIRGSLVFAVVRKSLHHYQRGSTVGKMPLIPSHFTGE